MSDAVKMAIEALRPFAACVEQIDPNEDSEEWAKFRLLVGDYRRAAEALAALEQAGEPPLSTLQRLGQEFDAPPVKECLTTAADASLPQRKDCGCDCHNPGSTKLHIMPCCRNDEPAADAGVTQGDREAAADAVKAYRGTKNDDWQGRIRKGLADDGQMVQAFAAHRLQSVAAATAAKDAEIARMKRVIDVFRRHYELNDCEGRTGNIEIPVSALRAAASLSAALSEAREAGDSIAAGDRV